jgi:hypothetical protein
MDLAIKEFLLGSKFNQNRWYGVRIDESNASFDLARISGDNNMSLHATLDVHNTMRACLQLANGIVNYYLDPTDWTKKLDGSASDLTGADGDVMIEVDTYYRRVDNPLPGIYDHKISRLPLPGWQRVNKFYYAAYEGAVQRSTKKLASVVNNTADYRGGNNTSAWDAESRTLLGKPVTNISLSGATDGFRKYARNKAAGTNWNVATWRHSMLIYELFMIEHATLHSQKAVNATLTVDGYKQGGLGAGVTTVNSTEWNNFCSYNPFVNCGASNSLASGTGEVSYTVNDFGGAGVNRTFAVPRYRGIEHPFGHIWEWQDGASVFHEAAGGVSKFYTSDNPANFADGTTTNYDYRSELPPSAGVGGTYVKTVTHDDKGVIIPLAGGAGSGATSYFCDYYYTPGLVNAWRACLRGGVAADGASAGFVYLSTDSAASRTSALIGSRLVYLL